MSQRRQRLGERGERAARVFLEQKGFTVVTSRYRNPHGEIDLVCKNGSVYVFVEVKTRRSKRFGPPEASITKKKFERMVRCANAYLQENKLGRAAWRLDVVSVLWNDDAPQEIRHFPAVDTPYQH
jgi:putative endonuclease